MVLDGCKLNIKRAMSNDAGLAKVEEKSESVGGARGDACKDNSLANRLVWVDLEVLADDAGNISYMKTHNLCSRNLLA